LKGNSDVVSDIPSFKVLVRHLPPVPKEYNAAMKSPFANFWKAAMQVEINAMKARNVWVADTLPEGRKALPSHWVFDYKTDKDGYLTRFKARIVAGGHHQSEGIDYEDIFAPVVKIQSI